MLKEENKIIQMYKKNAKFIGINLNVDGTKLYFGILDYKNHTKNNSKCYNCWCGIKLKIKNEYINYEIENELLESEDINSIIFYIKETLNGNLKENKFLSFTEDEISFKFYPYKEPYITMIISFEEYGWQKYQIDLYGDNLMKFMRFLEDVVNNKNNKKCNY